MWTWGQEATGGGESLWEGVNPAIVLKCLPHPGGLEPGVPGNRHWAEYPPQCRGGQAGGQSSQGGAAPRDLEEEEGSGRKKPSALSNWGPPQSRLRRPR